MHDSKLEDQSDSPIKKTMKTSEQWLSEIPKEYGMLIMDPEGWDKTNYDYSFKEELITEEEFKIRLMNSTVSSKPGGFDEYMKADNS